MQQYRYSPLDENIKGIRLMTLLAGSPSDPVVTLSKTIFHILRFWPLPAYGALSYAWNSEENPSTIIVRLANRPERGFLSVTRNLAEALPYLRYQDKDRILGSIHSVSTKAI